MSYERDTLPLFMFFEEGIILWITRISAFDSAFDHRILDQSTSEL